MGSNVLHTSYRADAFVDAVHFSTALEGDVAVTVRPDGAVCPPVGCIELTG